jgi:hypothetical protein
MHGYLASRLIVDGGIILGFLWRALVGKPVNYASIFALLGEGV